MPDYGLDFLPDLWILHFQGGAISLGNSYCVYLWNFSWILFCFSAFSCFSAAFWLLRLFGFGGFLASAAFWFLRLSALVAFWLPVASCFLVGPATF